MRREEACRSIRSLPILVKLFKIRQTSPWTYNTNQLIYEIESGEVLAEIQTQTGSVAEECEYYSNGKVGNRKCKP